MQIGKLRHLVTLDQPGTPTSDDDGGYTPDWTPLVPSQVFAAIEPASARDLERQAAGTVITTASHLIRMRYHAGVTTQTRITKGPRAINGSLMAGSREFSVVGVQNVEERSRELVIVAVELVP